jgi:hypothetical protein
MAWAGLMLAQARRAENATKVNVAWIGVLREKHLKTSMVALSLSVLTLNGSAADHCLVDSLPRTLDDHE